jgi:signal transduction histidine kinase
VPDFVQVESARISITLQPLELPTFLGAIVEDFQLQASRSQLAFNYQVAGELPKWIETDPLRLRQVLYNLPGNAMKFTAQGEVGLRVYITWDLLVFEVRDTGKGISHEDLLSICEPVYRATNGSVISQGIGIRLHHTKQISALSTENGPIDHINSGSVTERFPVRPTRHPRAKRVVAGIFSEEPRETARGRAAGVHRSRSRFPPPNPWLESASFLRI